MAHRPEEEFDLIVAGGGPAGAACATFVAMQGHRVLLLEKNIGPSFKIGESLLPATIHGICPLLGVSDAINEANFIGKTGGSFVWGNSKEPWDFLFRSSLKYASPTSTAYQVERRKFDRILLENARSKGVDLREGHNVTELVVHDGRAAGVRYTTGDGVVREATSRYVVDATGQQGRLSRFAGRRVYSRFFQNISIFRYYKGGGRLPEPNAGNQFSATFKHGWFWYIPLREDLTSVGVVFGQDQAQGLNAANYDETFDAFVEQCPEIKNLLADAVPTTEEPYNKTRACKDFAYTTTSFFNNGLALVGDTACFIDPLFSSGVHLATYSGLLAARAINTSLRGQLAEDEVFAEYEARFRREYANFYDFLIAFYDIHQHDDSPFWSARKVDCSPERTNREYIDLVVGSTKEKAKPSNDLDAFWTKRAALGVILFPDAAVWTSDRDEAAKKRSQFLASLFGELSQLQLQAILQEKRPLESPIRPNGLIPSRDGFHWEAPRAAAPDAPATVATQEPEVVI
jgi:halogenation protein CepH